MSTAVIDPPVIQTPPVVVTPNAADSILGSLKKANADRLKSAPGSYSTADQKKLKEKEAAAAKPTETPLEQKEPEKPAGVPPVVEAAKDDKAQNFAELRKAREAAEKERDELREQHSKLTAEFETYRGRPAPEEIEKQRTEWEKERNTLRTELRAAAIYRDPEFQAQYDSAIGKKQNQMVSILKASGVDANEAVQAVESWNKDKFNELIGVLPVLQQGEFANLVRGAEDLASERKEAIANADKTYTEREAQKKTQAEQGQKKFKDNMRSEALSVIDEMTGLDGIKDNAEITGIIKNSVLRAAPIEEGHMSAREVFKHVASSVLLAHITEAQQTELESLRADKAALEKKLQDQEKFITDRNGSIPKVGDGTGAAAKPKGETSELMGIIKKYSVTQNS